MMGFNRPVVESSKSTSLIGTTVELLTLDGVNSRSAFGLVNSKEDPPTGELLEVGSHGVLIKLDSGDLIFSTSCSFRLQK